MAVVVERLSQVPALLGAAVIIFAGYLLAKLFQRIVAGVLRRIQLNRMLERGGEVRTAVVGSRSLDQLPPPSVVRTMPPTAVTAYAVTVPSTSSSPIGSSPNSTRAPRATTSRSAPWRRPAAPR